MTLPPIYIPANPPRVSLRYAAPLRRRLAALPLPFLASCAFVVATIVAAACTTGG